MYFGKHTVKITDTHCVAVAHRNVKVDTHFVPMDVCRLYGLSSQMRNVVRQSS